MGILREAIAVILVIFMALALLLMAAGLTISTFLYPEPWIKSLRQAGAFEYASTQLKSVPTASFVKLPDGGLETLASSLITNFLAYMRSDEKTLNLSVEIDRQKLRSFFIQEIENASVCSPGEKPDFENISSLCRMPGKSSDELLDELIIAKNLSFLTGNAIDLSETYGINSKTKDGKKRLKSSSFRQTNDIYI